MGSNPINHILFLKEGMAERFKATDCKSVEIISS